MAKMSNPQPIEPAASADSLSSESQRAAATAEIRRGVGRLLFQHGLSPVAELSLANGRRADIAALTRSGDIWIVVAMLCWTLYALLLRRWPSVLDAFARLTAITFFGVLVLAPFTLAEALLLGWPAMTWQVFWLVITVALLPGFGAYQAYSFMQRELGAAKAGLALYLGPLYAAVTSWLLLGEAPGWFHLAGAVMILPGIWLATRSRRASA